MVAGALTILIPTHGFARPGYAAQGKDCVCCHTQLTDKNNFCRQFVWVDSAKSSSCGRPPNFVSSKPPPPLCTFFHPQSLPGPGIAHTLLFRAIPRVCPCLLEVSAPHKPHHSASLLFSASLFISTQLGGVFCPTCLLRSHGHAD